MTMNIPTDNIECDIRGIHTVFRNTKKDGRQIVAQNEVECRVLGSYSDGLVGFSVREKKIMLTVRIDELMEVLMLMSDAHQKLRAGLDEAFLNAERQAKAKAQLPH